MKIPNLEHMFVQIIFFVGEPTGEHPHPTLFMTKLSNDYGSTPKKRKPPLNRATTLYSEDQFSDDFDIQPLPESPADETDSTYGTASPDFTFEYVAKEGMVTFYTGLPSTDTFKSLHDYLRPKAQNMNY